MTNRAPRNTATQDPLLTMIEMVSGGPDGAVERMEARGQRELVMSDTLPTEGLTKVAEACGITVGEPVPGDGLFTFCALPCGWKKRPTEHSMWSEVVDDKERVRARIFYKAAFYDRRATIHAESRFKIERDYSDEAQSRIVVQVTDGGKVVFCEAPVADPMYGISDRDKLLKAYDERAGIEDRLRQSCLQWLAERGVTDPRNPALYWNVP